MNKYIVEGTKSTPYVALDYDEKKLVFEGQSYPENAYNVYEPIYKWLDEYFAKVEEEETIAEFFLSYINTSSTKCLIVLIEKLNKAYLQGKKIIIHWIYDEENGFDYEMGQDLMEDVDIPFLFIPAEDTN
ncbi:DUF1987 domain-containing protein [Clostridium formicaceticum]|uniref:SiaC family regulatory phosphoprotein domain-containing protein n=1 Tax=Clostridium formicaceticum TaxID=1497 RepID=A0AAC9RM34_9CLOT|nr:DUF1987 domain-containing protein [Clostridium formicaceticum]AOY77934.1 hypothetical protein BJL90_19955 [Clostridium formicaceticum]ARE88556.1 hypothetical protein CLFO_29620 [Clostridium formicaceticum]